MGDILCTIFSMQIFRYAPLWDYANVSIMLCIDTDHNIFVTIRIPDPVSSQNVLYAPSFCHLQCAARQKAQIYGPWAKIISF